MKFILISDFFLEDLPKGGGAEYNDHVIFNLLKGDVFEDENRKTNNLYQFCKKKVY